jgi:hypothetical protein
MIAWSRLEFKAPAVGQPLAIRSQWLLCFLTLRQEKGEGWGTLFCWWVESGMVWACGFLTLRQKKGARIGPTRQWSWVWDWRAEPLEPQKLLSSVY